MWIVAIAFGVALVVIVGLQILTRKRPPPQETLSPEWLKEHAGGRYREDRDP